MIGQHRTVERLPPKPISLSTHEDFRRAAREAHALRSLALALLSAEYAAKMVAARHQGGASLAARLAALEDERLAKELEIKLRTAAEQLTRRTLPRAQRRRRPRRPFLLRPSRTLRRRRDRAP